MSCNILVFLPDLCLDLREVILLIVVANALARVRVGIFAFGERCIVQLSTPIEHKVQLLLRSFLRIDAVLVRLMH